MHSLFVPERVYLNYKLQARLSPANPRFARQKSTWLDTLFFYIRTSNFGAEAERSYFFFFRFEAENVLKTFLVTVESQLRCSTSCQYIMQ